MHLCCWGLAGGSGGGWDGGGALQNCSFGRGSRMIRARSRMIRAGQSRSGTAREEHENGEKFDDFADFGWISRGRRWGKARSTSYTPNPRIKINKTSSKPTNHKKILGLFLVGIFGFRTKTAKSS